MSSGASTAYEKPRSGRSSCIDETPRSSRIASAPTPFAASCSRTTAKSPRRKPRLHAARASRSGRSTRARRVAVDRDQLAAAAARSAASSAAWPPAPNVASTTVSPGCTREELAHLVGEDGDVISRAWLQGVRQHPPHSLRLPRARVRQAARSQISRWSWTPATTTSRPSFACSSSAAGIITRPCLSGSASAAPEKKNRCSRRPSWLSGSSVDEPRLDEPVPVGARVGDETAVHAAA